MRIFLQILTIGFIGFLLIFQLIPSAFAHAGVQKRNKDYIVTFYQSPISPLVGEQVKITFVVTDHNLDRQVEVEGNLILIDTFYGDESKDKKIFDKKFITDANGAFEFEYTFDKENYFNIELVFKGEEDKADHIDFLVQPRKGKDRSSISLSTAATLFGFGSLVGIIITVILKKKVNK